MSLSTAELYDQHEGKVAVAMPLLRDFGGRSNFHGEVLTLRVFEDNTLVRRALEQPGRGRVLVVDGGGSLNCALVGDLLGVLALDNGWSGLIVNGCVRDSRALASIALGIKALNTNPRKSVKKGQGEEGVEVTFAGLTFRPGLWVYCDEDGIVLSETPLH
ncbi:MAG: ribonuclease E activity regulator RraA [Candidatus Eremiobacteraeota bacterium]|nr:ribonuclease E activity regulator RraA [Candidatus Eremiobacteraeota bacterium]MCW5872501.1 ribonuclease E activity regulator RraA [Candidatus Eremiobacteraeota bacterium]